MPVMMRMLVLVMAMEWQWRWLGSLVLVVVVMAMLMCPDRFLLLTWSDCIDFSPFLTELPILTVLHPGEKHNIIDIVQTTATECG